MQTYLDYRTPAIAAGAIHRKGWWSKPGNRDQFGFVSQFCREHGIEPVRLEPPKGRTFKAIQKAVRNVPAERVGGREHHAMRAVQYMLAVRGIETKHRQDPYGCMKRVRWEKAEDGSNRVRFVEIAGEWLEVPHWNFTPRVEVLA